MPNDTTSPLATYLSHLDKGELAYQFSPAAQARGVLSAPGLPVHRQRPTLEWRVSKGLGTVLRHHRRASGRGRPLQRGADRLRRGLPADEPGRGHRPDAGEDRHAGALPRASPGRRGAARTRSSFRRRPRDGRLEARQRGDRRRRRIRSRPGRRRHERHRPDGAGHRPRARRLRASTCTTSTACSAPPTQARTSVLSLAEYLGISPTFIDSTILGGSSFEFHVAHAVAAIAARAVQGRGDRLRLDPAQRRPQAGLGARDQPLRDAVPAVPAVDRLCAGGLAPHARVRHHARAAGRGRGGGAPMGAAQSRPPGRRSR